ncbi:MAG TPA: DNA gyrase inhibitor YacG [Pyrinomonadaceae bacterium]|jgi:endogenous inhibitor of DNA gyrase (YacG/DUF329 family)
MNCPLCGKPTVWQDNPHRPFCSERCKLIDFGKWADEEYRVPTASDHSSEHAEHDKAPSADEDREG